MHEHVAESKGARAIDGRSPDDRRTSVRRSVEVNAESLECAQRWRQITMSLSSASGGDALCSEGTERVIPQLWRDIARADTGCARIEILERVTDSAAILSWSDPTGGSYGHQVWHKSLAKGEGRCALSGTQIHRGDAIFRPIARGHRPRNALAMILAEHVDCPAS